MRDQPASSYVRDLSSGLRIRRPYSNRSLVIASTAAVLAAATAGYLWAVQPITAVDHRALAAMLAEAGNHREALKGQLLARFDASSLADLRQHQADDARAWIATRIPPVTAAGDVVRR